MINSTTTANIETPVKLILASLCIPAFHLLLLVFKSQDYEKLRNVSIMSSTVPPALTYKMNSSDERLAQPNKGDNKKLKCPKHIISFSSTFGLS
jgi:hypothetical protein